MTITQIETQIATYLGRDSVADLTQNGQDIGLYALNSARRRAEQAHDFKLSEVNCYLSIGQNGSLLSGATTNTSVTITGTLNPNIAGAWALIGSYNGLPLFWKQVSSVDYFLSSNGSAWRISTDIVNAPTNHWSLVTTSGNPAGAYAPAGSFTGTATVSNTTTGVIVKRVKYVSLPLNGGEYEPIEFLTSDEYTARARKQIGRQHFNPNKNLFQLGVSTLGNPLAYQNGLSLYLAGSAVTFPMTAQLSIVQFLPDYVNDQSVDWVTQYAPEFLYWQGIIECNNFFKRYTTGRVEGQVDTAEVQGFADEALRSLIGWDVSIVKSTSTPDVQGSLQPPAPVTPVPQAA